MFHHTTWGLESFQTLLFNACLPTQIVLFHPIEPPQETPRQLSDLIPRSSGPQAGHPCLATPGSLLCAGETTLGLGCRGVVKSQSLAEAEGG